MEGNHSSQVAGPLFIQHPVPAQFCEAGAMGKKRDLSWSTSGCQPQISPASLTEHSSLSRNWNPKSWHWDSQAFVAKPIRNDDMHPVVTDRTFNDTERGNEVMRERDSNEVEVRDLTLKLGGTAYSGGDDSSNRQSKRVRSSSPGNNYPMCQVDDCRADLTSAKDYHRRHKVCEFHSKTTKALVGKQMQRFCQQCSRFHPLQEFDEGKRSCRRRLAGHNKRRRKAQPEDTSSRLLSGSPENSIANGSVDLVNLIALLAQLQGNNLEKATNVMAADREKLLQILAKMNSLPVSQNSGERFAMPANTDLIAKQVCPSSDTQISKLVHNSPVAQADLLAVLSSALGASGSSRATQLLNAFANRVSEKDVRHPAANAPVQDQRPSLVTQSRTLPSVIPDGSSLFSPKNVEVPAPSSRPTVPLQLFLSSPEEESPSKMDESRKYFSSDSSNPIEERSPSSSPPVMHELFPMETANGRNREERDSALKDDSSRIEASLSNGWSGHLDLFKGASGICPSSMLHSDRQPQESRSPVQQGGYASSSGSDNSPATSSSDTQDRTGRIIFKLFDKGPSDLPHTLRSEILKWLAHSPSEMESYIRPGCVVLTVYVSMPVSAWNSLHGDLQQHLRSLISRYSEFWRFCRFLVRTDKQLASYKDGQVRLCKKWRTRGAPEVTCASPLAVVGGQETLVALRGRNLCTQGTKIYCTNMGSYDTREVAHISQSAEIEEFDYVTIRFPDGISNALGRCFVEVENGFKGNSFPIIIADAEICKELRSLESELEQTSGSENSGLPTRKEFLIHFLNELGWLFQRSSYGMASGKDFSHMRFKLLLVFSLERDWSALTKTLLDTLVGKNSDKEVDEVLTEVHPLNRAVKRRSLRMVNLLLHYSLPVIGESSKKFLFAPNFAGPGGITPLHLAASSPGSDNLVDALTNDPQEVGLRAWSSALDFSKQSPRQYASMRGYHSYNELVDRKLVDRANGQVSIVVDSMFSPMEIAHSVPDPNQVKRTPSKRVCETCAAVTMRRPRFGGNGLLRRPYALSMVAIAAVCVCVCILCRGRPQLGKIEPFRWENISYGWL